MNYLLLNGVVLGIVAVVGYTVLRSLQRGKPRRRITKPFWYTLGVVLVLTAVFDSLIIAAGIVAYDASRILEVYIGRAPIEDFAYACVSVILVVVLWEYYEHND